MRTLTASLCLLAISLSVSQASFAQDEADLRARLSAPAENPEQGLYVSAELPHTSRVMVKDEDICVHCGLCAERCPTGAWDMQKSQVLIPYAEDEAAEAQPEKAGTSAA